ncbi:AER102Wp [Eremothecium gossypii ATCC 10895]|uniref:AER102Wp n=1 Tax=Eremothecium gossypii (strain ATCC 10895 / CBS 109.51 / FGSC 9923 / NRRL Y-1056) TaxID=284811 RepID=Q757B1_EREGS|nr:AER102Wp [Eremothecium gossypii ATCC 10895]AAS52786.1 AER102Wp [Eremothecium gossypii ATCC 10895]AEY97092.1 FAER102Wp [Eremothecium gossypii FDAG1]
MGKRFDWQPTGRLVRGRIIRAFLPLKRHPQQLLDNPNYTNLYPGDEVYSFEETADGRWCRVYQVVQPLPEDFISTMKRFSDKLPEEQHRVVVCPKAFVHWYDDEVVTFPFLDLPDEREVKREVAETDVPSLHDLLHRDDLGDLELFRQLRRTRPIRPAYPFFKLFNKTVVDELHVILFQLCAHIYSMYSVGEFEIYEWLTRVYYKMDELRVPYAEDNILTEEERFFAVQECIALSSKISRYLALKGVSNVFDRKKMFDVDPSGYDAILSRHHQSGELLAYDALPRYISSVTMLHSLTPNFPISNESDLVLKADQNTMLDPSAPSQLLVDFKDVKGAPEFQRALTRLTAYLYLRTSKKRLTETFAVQVNSDKILTLDNISATLFNNIPATEIENSRIYLVVELVESLDVAHVDFAYFNDLYPSFVPFQSPNEDQIDQIRKGIAVGVADISRVFTRHRKAISQETVFHYKISLFSSYVKSEHKAERTIQPNGQFHNSTPSGEFCKMKALHAAENNGWGELVDRIILDSDKGIAVTPRALSLTVTVKEITNTNSSILEERKHTSAIKPVPSYFYDVLAEPMDRIYVTIGKVKVCHNFAPDAKMSNITIVISATNKNITFRNGSNESPSDNWKFISVRSGESVGETVRIDGVAAMEKDETLRISAYYGTLLAKAKFYIKKGNQILEYKKHSAFQLMSADNKPLIEVEVGTEYVGQKYNMERTIYDILALWRRPKAVALCLTGDETEESLSTKIMALKSIDTVQLVKYFDPILVRLLELNYAVLVAEKDKSSANFKDTTFFSLIQFLDKSIIRQETYRNKFNDFIDRFSGENSNLPPVGPVLIASLSKVFLNAQTEWNYVGRTACRAYATVVRLALVSSQNMKEELVTALRGLFNALVGFFSFNKSSALTDHICVLEEFDIVITVVSDYFDCDDLLGICSGFFMACTEKEHSTGMDKNQLNTREQKFVNTKLLLLRRMLDNPPLGQYLFAEEVQSNAVLSFINQVVEWSFQVFLKKNIKDLDMSSIRLANGILVTLLENSKSIILRRNLIRLLPTLCRFFILVWKYTQGNPQLKFGRTFTALFPTNFPFTEITVDSMVNERAISEPLIELGTILATLAKIVEEIYGHGSSFIQVVEDCANDPIFTSVFYITRFTKEDIISAVNTVTILTKDGYMPSRKWISLHALFLRTCVTILEMYKSLLIQYNVPPDGNASEFDWELWAAYLNALLLVGNNRVTSTIKLADLPRKAVVRVTGDLRQRIAVTLEEVWSSLLAEPTKEDHDRFAVTPSSLYNVILLKNSPSVLQHVWSFAFQRHSKARSIGTWMLWSTCVYSWKLLGHLDTVAELSISILYAVYQNGKVVPSKYCLTNFFTAVMHTVHVRPDDEAFNCVIDYFKNMYSLLHVISEMQDLPAVEEFDDLRTAGQLTIYGYLLATNKPEAFHNLINDLFVRSIKKKDYIQAGLALELLASTYDWTPNDLLPAIKKPPLPLQSSFERKEYLYKEAARNFARGYKLEKAMTIYKDLAEAYEKINYDLNGLAYVHGQIANLYTDLQNVDRLVPSYFKITFLGYGFPTTIRNRVFIYEGLPFEHITSLHSRMMKLYPGTELVQSQEEADGLLVEPPMGRFLHVVSVEPKFDISDGYANTDKRTANNNKVRSYIENRNLKTFSCSRRLPGTTSVTSLWVREFVYETVSTFPTLLNRSEVKSVIEIDRSPLDNAVRSLQVKIHDLSGLESMCYKLLKDNDDCGELFGELSRELNGTIDAPVNGGIAQYRDFFTLSGPDALNEADLAKLKYLFDELALVLGRCLTLHRELCPPTLMKSYEAMLEQYEKNFGDEIKRNNIDINKLGSEVLEILGVLNGSDHSLNRNITIGSQSSQGTGGKSSTSSNYSSKGTLSLRNGPMLNFMTRS